MLSNKFSRKKNKTQKSFITGASIATLVASGAAKDSGSKKGDVNGDVSINDDVLSIGDDGGLVNAGAGDDKITGGAKADFIAGGEGADSIEGGAGLDSIVLIGVTKDAGYSQADLANIGELGVDLSDFISLTDVNNHSVSDVKSGESIDGGADGALLFIFGKVDFTGVTLKNISKIYTDNEIVISDDLLQSLKAEGLSEFIGKGILKAKAGLLDLDDVKVSSAIDIVDADGNIITPTLAEGAVGAAVSLAENTSEVGSFEITDASAVGIVSYAITGADAALFSVSEAGVISFISPPDFENAQDAGTDNVYDITITATDEHQKSFSQDIAVTVTDINDPFIRVAYEFLKQGAEFLVNTEAEKDQSWVNIATLADGRVVMVWQTNDAEQDGNSAAVKGQIYNVDGSLSGVEFLVNSQTEAAQAQPTMVALKSGGFVVAWTSTHPLEDGDGYNIKAQIFNADGSKKADEFLVNSKIPGDQERADITEISDGKFVITWSTDTDEVDTDSDGIKAKIYNADGTTSGDEFLVNTQTTDAQKYVKIAGLTDGSFVIVWRTQDGAQDGDNAAVKAQKFSASGEAMGAEFLVNTEGELAQVGADIVALNNGGFAIFWHTLDFDQDGDKGAVKAQFYNDKAEPQGDEILVNTVTVDHQLYPIAETLTDGRVVVAWESYDPDADGDGGAIKAQIFNQDGSKAGAEFLVNSEAKGDQVDMSITALQNGGFAIAWETNNTAQDGSGLAVKAQYFYEAPVLKYTANESYGFDINSVLAANPIDAELGDVVISNIPDGTTFSAGNLLDGKLTLTQEQLAGLQITLGGGPNGLIDLDVALTYTEAGENGQVITSHLTVPLSVGNPVLGGATDDILLSTGVTDHIDAGTGSDTVKFEGVKADYTFALVGNDIQITHTASGTTNVDFVHAAESYKFGEEEAFNVNTLDDLGDITSLAGAQFDLWLVDNYIM